MNDLKQFVAIKNKYQLQFLGTLGFSGGTCYQYEAPDGIRICLYLPEEIAQNMWTVELQQGIDWEINLMLLRSKSTGKHVLEIHLAEIPKYVTASIHTVVI